MIRWLDQVTGKVTMYRLILLFLIALGVESLLLSVVGATGFGYSVLGILASAVVVVIVCYLVNRLFAALFRVKPQSESSAITGLILLFLFPPFFDLASLSGIALAGAIAMASKYLIAPHGRHLLNPAAVGAFVTPFILPSSFPIWWIGNIWLLPLVLVFGFVVLFRTRHLAMGGVFVVVAVIGVSVAYLLPGTNPLGYVVTSILPATPILFFAGFMLSEPLTLPPLRWQQLVEAALVGVLFGIQFNFSLGYTSFIWSYQAALLVGNLFAFIVARRRGIQLGYLGKTQLSPTSWELTFRPVRPIAFAAGQYMELTVPHRKQDSRGVRRTFSIASAPAAAAAGGEGTVSFGLRTAERSSSFKTTLLSLEPGAVVAGTSVGGDFTLPKDPATPILLVAGGIGITPFISQLAHLAATGDKRDVVLVYSSGSATDVAYLERLGFPGVRILLVAPAQPEGMPADWSYLGAGPLTAELLLREVPDAKQRAAYVSGAPNLVHSLKPALRKAGVRSVKSDYFSGY